MEGAIKLKGVHERFKVLYNIPQGIDTVILIGGRGGKKTYEVSRFIAFSATIRKKRCAILRDEKETIRESILNEVFNRYDSANKYGHFDGMYEKIENGVRDKASGNMLVFTKGFRASSLEKRTNLKGVSDTDIAVIEEAEDIRDFNKFSTFKDSIRTQDRLIIIILNTPDIQHWIVKRYFNLEEVEYIDPATGQNVDGYWKLIPKDLPGFMCIQSNFTDNKFLNEGVIRDYNAYGDPNSNMYDLHYYLTAILGYSSSGRKGQVLTKAKHISTAAYLALPYKEIYGLDFGTSSPAGIVGVKIFKDHLWARQLNYLKMDTLSIAKFFCRLNLKDDDLIIADSADPMSISKMRRGYDVDELSPSDAIAYPQLLRGFNIRGVIKGPGSIEFGLGELKSFIYHFCDESTDLWDETFNYVYAQNKEGEYTNDPVDDNNHLIDPTRYVAMSRGRLF